MSIAEFLTQEGWTGASWADVLCFMLVINLLALAGWLNRRRAK